METNISRYESGENVAFRVPSTYCQKYSLFDKKTLQRLHDLEQLEEDKKKTLLDLIDTYIHDAKGRKAYASARGVNVLIIYDNTSVHLSFLIH